MKNMKRKIILSLATVFGLFSLNSNAQIMFEITIPNGGSTIDKAVDIVQTPDNGYFAVGTHTMGSLLMLKSDPIGNVLWWQGPVSGPSKEGSAVQNTPNGKFIITGHGYNYLSGSHDILIMKTEYNGDVIWSKHYGTNNTDYGYSVQPTSDNGYIVIGSNDIYNSGNTKSDIYLIKTNSVGDSLWTKTFGGTQSDYGYSIKETSDNGYILAGYTESTGSAFRNMYLIKTDLNGDTLWTKTLGSANNNSKGFSVCESLDSGIVVTGGITEFNGTNTFAYTYTVKLDANGTILWESKVLGEEGQSIEETTDNGFIIARKESGLLKLDQSGNMVWSQDFSGYEFLSAKETNDNAFIVAGRKGLDPLVIKIGDLSSSLNEMNQDYNISLYPNPTSHQLTITTNQLTINKVSITDITGKTIQTIKSNTNVIDVSDLSNGVYFINISTEKGSITKKFLKQ
jgi:hypothetical protein